jgi:gamma-tubulin complex component 2
MSLRTSSANSDPHKDELTCELLTYTLSEQLFAILNVNGMDGMSDPSRTNVFTPLQNITGFEAFTLDYKVKWPLNLIISRKALTRYQMLFRHLFYCKFIERQLCNTWLLHQSTKELNLQRSSLFSCCLTQRMLHFSKNLIYNMTYEVLEQKWLKLENSLKTVSKFDDLITLHNNFLDECLKESLLLDQNLLKLITKLNSTCMVFSKYMQSFVKKNIGFTSSILLMVITK